MPLSKHTADPPAEVSPASGQRVVGCRVGVCTLVVGVHGCAHGFGGGGGVLVAGIGEGWGWEFLGWS